MFDGIIGQETPVTVVLRTAAESLKPCGLELGGKSAVIVFADADLDSLFIQLPRQHAHQRVPLIDEPREMAHRLVILKFRKFKNVARTFYV